jgi:hypothetical protein
MTLVLFHSYCHGLSQDKNQAAREWLRILKERGCVFLPLAGAPMEERRPEKKIDDDGSISSFLGVGYPILGKCFGHFEGRKKPREHGSADMTLWPGSLGYVRFSQDTDCQDPASWDPLANSLWEFGRLIYPEMRPDYSTLDSLGDNAWTNVDKLGLKYLFWRNIFGPRYVERYGRDFFLNAPGWKIEELSDGGIEYAPEQSFLQWSARSPKVQIEKAIKYFRKQFPRIMKFTVEPVGLSVEVSRMVLTDATGHEEEVYKRDQSVPEKPKKLAQKKRKPEED